MEEMQFRNRIYWLTFFFSILVIWVHSFNAELYLGVTNAAVRIDELEHILGEDLGQIAVPGFFMVSSYLFYRGFTWPKLLPKWKSRLQSILIPYLLWNFLYYMGYVAVTRIPAITVLIGKQPIPFDLPHLWEAMVNYAYNPVFWYLYQLILLIALAPVIYPIFRRAVTGIPALLLIAYALWNGWDFPHLNMDALFYTCTAACVSLHRGTPSRFPEAIPKGGQRLTCFLALLLSFAVLIVLGRPGALLYGRPLYTVLFRLWGVALSWLVFACLPLSQARDWIKHSFFLYAIHFAWVRLLNKAGALLFPPHPAFALAMFLLMPLFMLLISALLIKILRMAPPVLYRTLTGNR